MSNNLIHESSPYLLEHAENPVDWFAWGKAAFEKAKAEDKPIFLSIGYSTCHWCHVMAKESFEDEQVAAILNADFVSVKVDREERPDVDAVYMEVCTAINGSGGWPLTVIMTPDAEPFFACTYLSRAALIRLLLAVGEKWENQRQELIQSGSEISRFINAPKVMGSAGADEGFLKRAAAQLSAAYDEEYGGFGKAPKFPSPQNLLFLIRLSKLGGDEKLRRMAENTLSKMYRGGIYDHIGGGFARYSTDREWLKPHFEKTLYDNALLALCYTEAWQEGHFALYRQVAEATLDFCLRELLSPEGGFCAALDADSEGVEGAYYLFTPAEVREVLGEDAGRHFCECYDITDEGNFNGGSIPNLLLNTRWQLVPEGYGEYRQQLREYRAKRFPLKRDDKLLTSWNGLMLMALSRAAKAFDSSRYYSAARALADFLKNKDGGGELTACRCKGRNSVPAQLDDYVFYALGLLELYNVSLDVSDARAAEALAEKLSAFSDSEGGFFRTAQDAETLIKRPKELYDGALPSGNSGAAVLLDLLRRLTGKEKWRAMWEEQLRYICRASGDYPAGCPFALSALMSLVYPTKELVCAADAVPELLDSVTGKYAPELTVLLKTPEQAELLSSFAPFTHDMKMLDGKATFYLCSGGTCAAPFTV